MILILKYYSLLADYSIDPLNKISEKIISMELTINNAIIPVDIIDRWQEFVDTISDLVKVPSVMINRLDPPDLEVFRSNTGPDNPFPSGTRMPLMGVYCEAAAKRRRKVQVVDARKDPEWADSPTAQAGIYAYLGYPLFWPGGEIFGTLCVIDTQENKWGGRVERLITSFKEAVETHLNLTHTIEQLNTANRRLEKLAAVDPLTGILNRRSFFDQAANYISAGRYNNKGLTVMMLDIDHFKSINDRFGHSYGDEVLKHFTDTCESHLRKSDVIARIGGEEFAVALFGAGLTEAQAIADRIRTALQENPVVSGDQIIAYTVSIGISMLSLNESHIDQALQRADSALYQAKREGRNRTMVANVP